MYFPPLPAERTSKPEKCRGCGRWFIPNPALRNVSCTVHHPPGSCCHFSEFEVEAPAKTCAWCHLPMNAGQKHGYGNCVPDAAQREQNNLRMAFIRGAEWAADHWGPAYAEIVAREAASQYPDPGVSTTIGERRDGDENG